MNIIALTDLHGNTSNIAQIGNTKIINPGPFKMGHYAVASINDQLQIQIELT